jgi:hypothetical protein
MLDIHKESIAVAYVPAAHGAEVVYLGTFAEHRAGDQYLPYLDGS